MAVVFYLIASFAILGGSQEIRERSKFFYPSYQVWLVSLGFLAVLILYEELTKKTIRKLFDRDHSRLMIFFSTKLGMWSPR